MSKTATASKTEVSATTSGTKGGKNDLSSSMPTLCENQVRELAYSLWEEAGRPEGDGVQFWLQAEEKLKKS